MSGAIGVFDSGLGGLSCVRELVDIAPDEDIVFFGDTARLPYGTKASRTIVQFALQDMTFLLEQGVKMIIAACGTVSTNLPAEVAVQLPVPYLGVVDPTAAAAAAATKNGRIGILGTAATVKSGRLEQAILSQNPALAVTAKACPLFVPLVENGYVARDCTVTRLVAEEYLRPLKDAGVDTVVLGCTHYPLIADIIADLMGGGVTLIDSGRETALSAVHQLEQRGLRGGEGRRQYFVSDDPHGFSEVAGMFLGRLIEDDVHTVNLDGIKPHSCFEEVQ